MKYRAIKLEDQIDVLHNGAVTKAKVRRIGPVQGAQRWAMLTLDVDGQVAFMPAHERELDNPVAAGAR